MKKVELFGELIGFVSVASRGLVTLLETLLTNFCSAIFIAVFVDEVRFPLPIELSGGISSAWLANWAWGGENTPVGFRFGGVVVHEGVGILARLAGDGRLLGCWFSGMKSWRCGDF